MATNEDKEIIVNLTWTKRIGDFKWKKFSGGRREKVFVTAVPKILRDLGPENSIDLRAAWASRGAESDANDAAGTTAGSKAQRSIIEANKLKKEEEAYVLDSQQIAYRSKAGSKAKSTVDELIGVRSIMRTDKGNLTLLLEILKCAVMSEEKTVVYDVLWALEQNELYKKIKGDSSASATASAESATDSASAEERYKKLSTEAKKMNVGALQKECTSRGIDVKGLSKKEDLLAKLLPKLREESINPVSASSASGDSKGKDSKDSKKSKEKTDAKKSKSSSTSASAAAGGAAVGASSASPGSAEELIQSFDEYLNRAKDWRSSEPDIVKLQLTDMSHLLPPLSPFTSKFKLDEWQLRTMQYIEDQKSVLICAPTSSGKTILSSFVVDEGRHVGASSSSNTSNARRPNAAAAAANLADDEEDEDDEPAFTGESVLFIVPTQPLAWQVAAHFAKSSSLMNNVSIVTEALTFCSLARERNKPSAVVVGTPSALEAALCRITGGEKTGIERNRNIQDQGVLVGGLDHYKWVVYDEVHSLSADSPDGRSLQRLVKMLKCNFLALSATVGNSEQLRSWMERIKGTQIDAEVVEAPPEAWEQGLNRQEIEQMEENRLVKKQVHEVRFINLQRHVWTDDESAGGQFTLKALHPLSSVSLEFLQNFGFRSASLPMTPQDSYVLWTKLQQYFDAGDIADLDPKAFFAPLVANSVGAKRITLQMTKDYELHLKSGLVRLAQNFPDQTRSLLESFQLHDLPSNFRILDLVLHLKKPDAAGNDKLPALVFHLDSFELIKKFQELLHGLEASQREAHPFFYDAMVQKQAANKAAKDALLASLETEDEKDLALRDFEEVSDPDFDLPHPNFSLARAISREEYDDICKEVIKSKELGDRADAHALIRGLRRGIGLYINDVSLATYKRVVQRLATRGKLAVVFSDESLAFGVNMPFRSCIFCGDMGGRLDSLMLQQMSGRAGRRGLDTQGHLIYAGSSATFIRDIMLSKIPAVVGTDPRYLTMFLPTFLSPFANSNRCPWRAQILNDEPLVEYVSGNAVNMNYNDISRDMLLELKFIEECHTLNEEEIDEFDYSLRSFQGRGTPSGFRPRQPYNPAALWLMWDLRHRLAESVALTRFLPFIYDEFANNSLRPPKCGDLEDVQIEFVAMLLHIIDRRPVREDIPILSENRFITSTTNVKRENLRQKIAELNEGLQRHHDEILALDIPMRETIMLAVPPGEPIDGLLFHCFERNSTSDVPPALQLEIKERLLTLGNCLKSIHDALMYDSDKYGRLELITRKCFQRVFYISREHTGDAIDFKNVSSFEYEGKDISRLSIFNNLSPVVEAFVDQQIVEGGSSIPIADMANVSSERKVFPCRCSYCSI